MIGDNPPPASIALGHTRWATTGKPTVINAHPHSDEERRFALVHNGIIENHAFLRKFLWEKGVEFTSETDTEVIVQLIAYLFDGEIVKAVQQAAQQMEGFWAIALIDAESPDTMIAAAQGNPLAIGLSQDESLISSDPQAFARSDLDIYFLKSGEVASITPGAVQFFDEFTEAVAKSARQLHIPTHAFSKGGYPHFMLKEISEQPEALQSALHSRFLLDYGTAQFEQSLPDELLRSFDRVVIVGCGTSWHAGCLGASFFESLAGVPTQVEVASEFRAQNRLLTKNTLVIALSQSGETLDTLAAMRELKAKGHTTLAICNASNSTLVREADGNILLRSGPEISVCSTKAFTSCLVVLALLALQMGRLRSLTKKEGKAFLAQLLSLPSLASQVVEMGEEIKVLAGHYASYKTFFFLGRHTMYPTCLEAALKLKEISYLNATGYPSGELKHGPIALIDDEVVTIGLCGNQQTLKKMVSNLEEVKARGGKILAFAPSGSDEISAVADEYLILPETIDLLAPIPYSIACQLFAYHIAVVRGTDIDQPRNLAKSVTVE
ncbi:MAG: Glutamine--fructose-6-phosphate aminotransferase [isomerizing] [Chlamydiae bacterium]|nr:Glutamine--fructose-6-phosphate aminotransferase [isomerizing] [Chlamydiota bacterium]